MNLNFSRVKSGVRCPLICFNFLTLLLQAIKPTFSFLVFPLFDKAKVLKLASWREISEHRRARWKNFHFMKAVRRERGRRAVR
mmetsp:Transcript_13433/g.30625  ORF Transcript_13433/g.30625 Transcript_13433/m.30625 type:complete len:83 (+) Transcript_13433:905-1153(+)